MYIDDELSQRIALLSPEKQALLGKLLGGARSSAAEVRPPQSPTECALAVIWAEIFGLDQVGLDDNFFTLGGDSIVGIRLVAKARRAGLAISSRDLFGHPILSDLAVFIDARGGIPVEVAAETQSGDILSALGLDPTAREAIEAALASGDLIDAAPLTALQSGMLYHILGDSSGGSYFEQTHCTLTGPLDIELFRKAWQEVIDAHPILRTAFHWEGASAPYQLVHRSAGLDFDYFDWSDLDPGTQGKEMADLVRRDVERGFDLGRPPLMRLSLARVGAMTYRLLWSSYHLILDAWSLPLLWRDVIAAEAALRAGRESSLPTRPGFAIHARRMAAADHGPFLDFWAARLDGVVPCATQFAGSSDGPPSAQTEHEFDQVASDRLYTALRRCHLTLGSAAQAAWALLLSVLTGRDEVLFGISVAGRVSAGEDVGRTVGPFLNTEPARIVVSPDRSIGEWAAAIQDRQGEAERFEAVPLTEIARRIGKTELFDSLLVVLAAIPSDISRDAVKISQLRATGTSNYPLVLRLAPEERLRVEILYRPAHIRADLAERLVREFARLIEAIALSPEMQVGSLSAGISRSGWRFATPAFKRLKPTTIRVERQGLVAWAQIGQGDRPIPMVSPTGVTLEAAGWLKSNAGEVRAAIARSGGLLLRGFVIPRSEDFGVLAREFCGNLLDYRERSTPRTALSNGVYTSTEYPPDETIALHNEFSYGLRWPRYILFHCVEAPTEGGETPIADCLAVYRRIPEAVRMRFERKGVCYVRNHGAGIDLTWQQVYQTEDRAAVDAYCRAAKIDFDWGANGELRTRQARRAVIADPGGGEPIWFNQAHLFHSSNLGVERETMLTGALGTGALPRNACFADGTPIPPEDLAAVRDAYRRSEIVFSWQPGDLLLLDNVRMAHGRNSYTGRRRVLVCMGEPVDAPDHAVEFGEEAPCAG